MKNLVPQIDKDTGLYGLVLPSKFVVKPMYDSIEGNFGYRSIGQKTIVDIFGSQGQVIATCNRVARLNKHTNLFMVKEKDEYVLYDIKDDVVTKTPFFGYTDSTYLSKQGVIILTREDNLEDLYSLKTRSFVIKDENSSFSYYGNDKNLVMTRHLLNDDEESAILDSKTFLPKSGWYKEIDWEGMYWVWLDNKKYSPLDSNFNLLDIQVDYYGEHYLNLNRIRCGDRWGLMNLKAEMITDLVYREIEDYDLSCMLVAKKDGKYGYLNCYGKEVTDFVYDTLDNWTYDAKEAKGTIGSTKYKFVLEGDNLVKTIKITKK